MLSIIHRERHVKIIMALILILPALVISLPEVACSSDVEPIRVVVSVQPQAYFVERVGGKYVDVEVLVGPGRSPATYEPTPPACRSSPDSCPRCVGCTVTCAWSI
jgi:ABC-type Zn uptake system ZnuABC Zn-binding protein ZnuA